MQYNYDFEIMSLVIFVVISGHFLLIRQFPTLFRKYLADCFGCVLASVSQIFYHVLDWQIDPIVSANLERIVYVCFFCVRGSGFLSDVPLYGRGMQLFRSSRSNDKIHGKSPVFLFRDHAFSDTVDGLFILF